MINDILSNKKLLLLGTAETISNIGNWITMMAIFSLLVFQGEGGVSESSGIFLAGLLPTLIFSPLAGKLADSLNKTWLMIASNILSGLIISGLIFTERIELIYLCLALEATFLSIIAPARQGLIPHLMPTANLTQANAFLQQLASLTKILGPMIGALIVGVLGPHKAVLLDLVSFFISAGLLILLLRSQSNHPNSADETHTAPERAPVNTPQSIWSALRDNFSVRLLFISAFWTVIAIMGYDILSSIYTRDILHADEGFYGVMIGSIGLGSVLSGLFLLLRKGTHHPLKDMSYGLCLLAVLLASLVVGTMLNPNVARIIALIGALIGGWGNGLVLVQANTLLQTNSPPAMLGRLAGLFQSSLVAGQLVSMVITPIIVPRYLSVPLYFTCCALGLLVIATLILVSLRRHFMSRSEGELTIG